MSDYDAWQAFRQGEIVRDVKLVCTECGKRAQGNYAWADGSGDVCDDCAEKQDGTSENT